MTPDPFGSSAYDSTTGEHVLWNYQQTMYGGAGTSGFFSHPTTYDIGGQVYNPGMQYYTPPAWEAWASRGMALTGATLITVGTMGLAAPAAWAVVGGMWGGAAVGAGVGAGVAYAKGWDINRGAGVGADIGSFVGAVAGPGAMRVGSRVLGMSSLSRESVTGADVASAGYRKAGDWLRFWSDKGGMTIPTGMGAPYTGRLAGLNRLGLRQGISTVIRNLDAGGSWFARVDTAAHEGFHALVGRYLPSIWRAGAFKIGGLPVGAPVKYLHEVAAYAVGHAGALRFHAIPFVPLEAFGSLSLRESLMTIGVGIGAYEVYDHLRR